MLNIAHSHSKFPENTDLLLSSSQNKILGMIRANREGETHV